MDLQGRRKLKVPEKEEKRTRLWMAIDVAGGDGGLDVTLPGLAMALEEDPGLGFELHGPEAAIANALKPFPTLRAASRIEHAEHIVPMDAKPMAALRAGRGRSSLWRALEATREGRTQVTLSAGNTGALMAMATFCLGRLPAVSRPALAALWITLKRPCLVLDLGASIGGNAEQLVQNALMGAATVRTLLNEPSPRVALLNIGVEDAKGYDYIKQAHQALAGQSALSEAQGNPDFRYVGFIEANHIGVGDVDVIVAEGFVGNTALKSAEGTAKQMAQMLRRAFSSSPWGRICQLLSYPIFRSFAKAVSPSRYNGAILLGVKGLVIKSHGSTNAEGFAAATLRGARLARSHFTRLVEEELAALDVGAQSDGDPLAGNPNKNEADLK